MFHVRAVNKFIYSETATSQKTAFDKNCLDAHNKYRASHGSPPLVWSDSLAAAAQRWADTLAKREKFEHDFETLNKENSGENLAYFAPPRKKCMGDKKPECVQCSEMVDDWYKEVKDFDFKTGKAKTPGKAVAHFTQVNKSITELKEFYSRVLHYN